MPTPSTLLETYVRAKDENQPKMIAHTFASDAVVTFSIATSTIRRPSTVRGIAAIARTLVTEFGQRYQRCRSYYVCKTSPPDRVPQLDLAWLVVMRDTPLRTLRMGKGLYHWSFTREAHQLRVATLDIHIERMDAIDDADGTLLTTTQAGLSYPWLAPGTLADRFSMLAAQSRYAYLRDFCDPTPVPSLMERPPAGGHAMARSRRLPSTPRKNALSVSEI